MKLRTAELTTPKMIPSQFITVMASYPMSRELISDPFLVVSNSPSISFKRKQKQVARFSISNLFSDSSSRPLLGNNQPRSQGTQERPFQEWPDSSITHGQPSQGNLSGVKDGGPLDWHVEGPGRRVGYDDLTAIDWIFEYTKERQRKRLLYSKGQGLLGHIRHLLDASHVWLVLVATGIFVGILAASIDIASDWLSDIKTGYCNNGRGGGKFYLNKSFCCWGHEGDSATGDSYFFTDLTLKLTFIDN
jgi:chloride channel 3/4/5